MFLSVSLVVFVSFVFRTSGFETIHQTLTQMFFLKHRKFVLIFYTIQKSTNKSIIQKYHSSYRFCKNFKSLFCFSGPISGSRFGFGSGVHPPSSLSWSGSCHPDHLSGGGLHGKGLPGDASPLQARCQL